MIVARQSTARTVTVGPVLDADGVAVTDGVVADFKISKAGAAPAALNGSATLTHRHTGFYSLALTATDLDTVGQAEVVIDDTVNACPMKEITVIEEAVYDALFAASATGLLPANVTQISGDSAAADKLEAFFENLAFVTHDGTDSTSGATLKSVVEAATARTIIYVGPGTYALGNNVIVVPDGVSVFGAGRTVTRITSTFQPDGILQPGSNSRYADLAVQGVDTAASQAAISVNGKTNVELHRVWLYATADALIGISGAQVRVHDSVLTGNYDGVAVASDGTTVDLFNCIIDQTGPNPAGSSHLHGISASTSAGSVKPRVRMFGGKITCTGGDVETYAADAIGNIELYDVDITATATAGLLADVHQEGTGSLIVSGVSGTGTNGALVTDGTITVRDFSTRAIALGTQAKLDVNAEADTALSDYDGPTNAEMIARTLPSADYALASGVVVSTNGIGALSLSDAAVAKIEAALMNEGDGQALIDAIVQAIDNADLDGLLPAAVRDAILNRVLFGNHDIAGSVGKVLQDMLTNAAAILVDTDTTIPAQIAALNNLSAAQVNTEVDTALADYDGPTNAEMVARTLVAAGYATATALQTVDNEIAVIDGIVDDVLVDTGTTIPAQIAALNNLAAGAAMTLTAGERTTLAGVVDGVLTTAHDAGSWGAGGGGGSFTLGPGANEQEIYVKQADNDAVADVQVWISSDEDGSTVVAGIFTTDSNGLVHAAGDTTARPMLTDGTTYWLWRKKDGVNFGSNPIQFTAE